ncbi:2Fe-2S iron-sulfur cluster binding domain-containing protein [Marinomonas sp.]
MSCKSHIVKLDGLAYHLNDGDNLLSALLAQSVSLAHGCRAGVCGACRLYSLGDNAPLLSCQTTLKNSLSLSRRFPVRGDNFDVLEKSQLDDHNLVLTLLGPSDDSFGDRLTVLLPEGNAEAEQECMAINRPGEKIQILLQKNLLSFEKWTYFTRLKPKNLLSISVDRSQRKGRMLVDLSISDMPVLLIASYENHAFERYWRDVLQQLPAELADFVALSSKQLGCSQNLAKLTEVLQQACQKFGAAKLQIVYHGSGIPATDWEPLLREHRIRLSQLHFVR